MGTTRGWKSDEERGPTGAWFVRAIGERSIEQVAKDMAERGHPHNPDYYRGIMSGSKKPGRSLLAALSEYLGSSPDATTATSDQTALIAALHRQAEALEALVAVLAHREGITPSALPPGVRELAARLVGEERALQDEDDGEGSHRAAAS